MDTFKELFLEAKMSTTEILSAAKSLAKNGDEKAAAFGAGLVKYFEKESKFTPDQVSGLQNIMKNASFQMAKNEADINEGTEATITTFIDGLYKTSILQYDGYESFMAPELKKYWSSPKKAAELTTKSGELRGVYQGDAEYYTDRKLLQVTKDETKAITNASDCYYKYFYDGEDWYWTNKSIRDFSKMKKI